MQLYFVPLKPNAHSWCQQLLHCQVENNTPKPDPAEPSALFFLEKLWQDCDCRD